MSKFKELKVKEVKRETDDTVSIAFEIPESQKQEFTYEAGQYITIKHQINGEEVRRSYSLSSAPFEDDFRVAVKKIENGKMSTFLNTIVKSNDVLEVLPPLGTFKLSPQDDSTYVAFAAGSGITPVISMIKSTLENSNSKIVLFYANKTKEATIFKSELDQLFEKYPERFKLQYLYTRQPVENKLFEGRINKTKFEDLMRENMGLLKADGYFMCGPEQMIKDIADGLEYFGVDKSKIHYELFVTSIVEDEVKKTNNDFSGVSHLTVIMDGDEFEFELKADEEHILDAAIENGVDAPFSCKGAVCCTCKAQVIEGKAVMDMNYALSDEEVEQGFILTCQAHPASDKVVVDFDVI